jgi:O-antigen ligase
MLKKADNDVLGKILIWTALLATLLVLPWTTFDPINVPKLAVISIGGFIAAALLVVNFSAIRSFQNRLLLIFVALFILDLAIVLLFSGDNFYQGLFGTFGRATGFVAYLSLTFLLLAAAIAASKELMIRFSLVLLFSGLLSNVYGLFQSFEIDAFKWVNQYSPVIGFLGNPNFQSSFIGFSGIAAFSFLMSKNTKSILKASIIAYLILTCYVIKATDSQQGFLVLLGGIGIIVLVWIPKSKFKFLMYPSLFLGLLSVFLITLGSLNKGPLASLLYKLSVTYRGDYWQAGWKMTLEHPLLGVGLDGYGDWYRRVRTLEATLRRGPEVTSNAAHNVLLDLSSNGGFPLVTIYLAILVLVVRAIFKVLKRTQDFEPTVTGLIAVWVAYIAQSIISLNQLGLAVWGWIISGLIIGYEIQTREKFAETSEKPAVKNSRKIRDIKVTKTSPQVLLAMFVGFLVGALMGLPPVIASTQYLSALKSQDAKQVEKAAYIWPMSPYPMGQVAITLANNNLQPEALKILTDGVSKFPNEFSMWRLLSEIPNASPEQVIEAKRQMKRLDPLNPNLK